MEKVSWSDIPSLDSLEVDWEYTPENPLGKRAWVRISNIDLHRLLSTESISVKVVSRTFNAKGYLLDISPKGLAALMSRGMEKGTHVNVGLFLGRYKVTSHAVVRNSREVENNFRVGLEFIGLREEHAAYITGINSSKVYGHKR